MLFYSHLPVLFAVLFAGLLVARARSLDGIPGSDTVMQELEVPLAGVETGTVTLRVLHFDYAEAGKGFNSAASMLRANAVSY